jgi:dienelactone hydrolase
MAHIVLFHSALGLRTVEHEAAARLEDWGHRVTLPDLYAGRAADAIDEGVALMDEIGWTAICERARAALAEVPDTAVLFGMSMGAGVIGDMWPGRLAARAIILLHGLATIPAHIKSATPVAVHVADPDAFIPPGEVGRWQARAAAAGMLATIATYPGTGHFFTDPALPDFSPAATEATWAALGSFLNRLD